MKKKNKVTSINRVSKVFLKYTYIIKKNIYFNVYLCFQPKYLLIKPAYIIEYNKRRDIIQCIISIKAK